MISSASENGVGKYGIIFLRGKFVGYIYLANLSRVRLLARSRDFHAEFDVLAKDAETQEAPQLVVY